MAKQYEVTAMTRVVNRITARMSRWGRGNFVVLTTTGRASGAPRTVVVSPIDDAGARYLVSPYGESAWVLNARAEPQATLTRRGTEQRVTLREVTGTKPELVQAYYEREGFARGFMDVPGDATVDDFAAVADRFPVFLVEDRPPS